MAAPSYVADAVVASTSSFNDALVAVVPWFFQAVVALCVVVLVARMIRAAMSDEPELDPGDIGNYGGGHFDSFEELHDWVEENGEYPD